MIVVTGAGRCGSSLMMQTLSLLGVPMIGNPEKDFGVNTMMHEDSEGILAARLMKMNPKGYWELPISEIYQMVDNGFPEHTGHAIKVMGAAFTQLDTDDIERVIFCKRRDRLTQAEGLHKLSQIDLQIKDGSNSKDLPYIDWFRNKNVSDVFGRQELTLNHIQYVLSTDEVPTLDIFFEDIVSNPKPEIEKVVHFLNLDVDISKAIENVDVRNEASV
tara:strand:- start:810 stop:1460 length:651 start_codon:yes stop_codon:yes gene_type:complete